MSRRDLPTLNEHVLHRQPRLSRLVRRRELPEKVVGLWAGRVRGYELKEQIKSGAPFSPQLYPVHQLETKNTGMTQRHIDNRRSAVAELSDDAPGPIGLPSSCYGEVARYSTASSSTTLLKSNSWGQPRLSTDGRQSSEWEMETLLDQSSAGLDDMASYSCPFRKRNPARFNIRDHETCARAPFDSIRGLK
jgi:hypothetical protein